MTDPAQRLEDIKDQTHEVLMGTGMSSWEASRLASMIELIARLVVADDKQRDRT